MFLRLDDNNDAMPLLSSGGTAPETDESAAAAYAKAIVVFLHVNKAM